ncbi:protein-L-isoaspartate O-methyltransferase [Devosia sp.]|uniref:protein-L-isoaspartate O-methyltransferase family protein n=1 Tax=Devosia sp. TaxID=1871048 RepID=UPI001AD3AA7F|nr:protein-L-isoaspartate O-methyltransferase [Devosia sp.]MBN9335813.1 protein-L-isoaspartate O-methyltransferase [Devosia sp.]
MIDSQLRPSGVIDRRVLSVMADVPRELFVAATRRGVAYVDDLQPLASGQHFLLSPAQFGRMVQLAKVANDERVLDVGAASGYSTAVLAGLSGEVLGLEVDADVAEQANANLLDLEIQNAKVVVGEASGLTGQFFDAIIVEGAVDSEPHDLIALLAPGGRLVVPILRRGVAVVHVYVRNDAGVMFTSEFDARMPRLWNVAPKDEFVF